MRLTLTNEYQRVPISGGLIQNLSSDASIEISEDTLQGGIILAPSQIVPIQHSVCARAVSGSAILAVVSFGHFSPCDCSFDDADFFTVQIPRALVEQGQSKFIVDFSL